MGFTFNKILLTTLEANNRIITSSSFSRNLYEVIKNDNDICSYITANLRVLLSLLQCW